jgi:hypothetical protein
VIAAFLNHLERDRHNSPAAALQSRGRARSQDGHKSCPRR